MCVHCAYSVYLQRNPGNRLAAQGSWNGCINPWCLRVLILAQPTTELMLECHFCRNADLWQTGLNRSHMVCVSPSVTAHRQFSIHLGRGTLGGVWARHLCLESCADAHNSFLSGLQKLSEAHKQLFLQWSGVLLQHHLRLSLLFYKTVNTSPYRGLFLMISIQFFSWLQCQPPE